MYRIDSLLKLKEKLFHTGDLALLWGITNKNTLYTTIKRYVQKGILIPIHKGFYSTIPIDQIDPFKLAIGYLHRFTYVSCETVLIREGIIFQKENYLTLVSSVSKKFIIADHSYFVRQLKDNYLYYDRGIDNVNGVMTANVERAVADLLYFNPKYYFDNKKKINWKKVKEMQKDVGY
ncbi:MAG: type IV toxin-antitoxin system AbiEi family antitoxin domain-containing protein [Patescibacteria group bacterium]